MADILVDPIIGTPLHLISLLTGSLVELLVLLAMIWLLRGESSAKGTSPTGIVW